MSMPPKTLMENLIAAIEEIARVQPEQEAMRVAIEDAKETAGLAKLILPSLPDPNEPTGIKPGTYLRDNRNEIVVYLGEGNYTVDITALDSETGGDWYMEEVHWTSDYRPMSLDDLKKKAPGAGLP